MPISNFRFVSPGVFINEIDESFATATAPEMGPVIIGRAERGLAMQPITVESYADFVATFGQPVPGRAGGDIYRHGNFQSPMYGTYAAKAFLHAQVAPLTYIRLLGQETSAGSTAGGDAAAGWKTTNLIGPQGPGSTIGGAYGLWVFPSGSGADLTRQPQVLGRPDYASNPSAGTLAAIFYMNSGSIELTGALRGGATVTTGRGTGQCIGSDTSGVFTAIYTDSTEVEHTVQFSFVDTNDNFIRNRFNTNPQLLNASGTFYPTSDSILLGETFEDNVRNYYVSGSSLTTQAMQGVIYGIQASGSTTSIASMKQASREAVAGWFIGQDVQGDYATYSAGAMTKLFRLKGRGHGAWLNKNLKVSIEKIRESTTTSTDYGTFSVVLRGINDTDPPSDVVERYDGCSLDPSSPNFVARVIGDKYWTWDSTGVRLKQYGEYDNRSSYVYVEMNSDVEAGATDPRLLPFGYFGPPTFAPIISGSGMNATEWAASGITEKWITYSGSFGSVGGGIARAGGGNADRSGAPSAQADAHQFLSAAFSTDGPGALTASLYWPVDQLRVSASAGVTQASNAYFGFLNTRGSGSTDPGSSYADWHRLLYADFPDDPVAGQNPARSSAGGADLAAGVYGWSYIFSMDDVRGDGGSGADQYFYQSGSRKEGLSVTVTDVATLLNAGHNKFTAPFWGGFDGFNIQKPDPMYNNGMASTDTEDTNYIYHTYRRAINTVADAEFVNMNLLAAPGLTQTNLTQHMIDVCEARGDALALIDLPDVYIPAAEGYYNTKAQRIGTTPTAASTALKDRRIDSSYGCTFYPWVQTRDTATGRLLWIPPSVAMCGVLASSEKSSAVWFAPAGFNRGGLTDGAAGLTITNVTERVTSDDRDTLYENRINPIASFPSTGIVVFGQKTLQARASALDRINVRRLVIYLKKQISFLSSQILFEQNVEATWTNFKSLIEPLLANTQAGYGITDYRLILDNTTTTPDLIDQNVLYAKIMVKPARAIEYIAIDFIIMNSGASFDD